MYRSCTNARQYYVGRVGVCEDHKVIEVARLVDLGKPISVSAIIGAGGDLRGIVEAVTSRYRAADRISMDPQVGRLVELATGNKIHLAYSGSMSTFCRRSVWLDWAEPEADRVNVCKHCLRVGHHRSAP